MQYKQPKAILRSIAKTAKSAKVLLEAIELMKQPLPKLGGYESESVCNLLWRVASSNKIPAGKRLIALKQLLDILAESKLKTPLGTSAKEWNPEGTLLDRPRPPVKSNKPSLWDGWNK
jgi:hypothetical protein